MWASRTPTSGGDALQYIELDIVRHAAAILADVEEAGQNVGCEYEMPEGRLCGRPAVYLVPDAMRAGGDGQDVERGPDSTRGYRAWPKGGRPPTNPS